MYYNDKFVIMKVINKNGNGFHIISVTGEE